MRFTKGITVDGERFEIPLVALKRSAEFVDKYAERTEDGVLQRELTGVYYHFTLNVGSSSDFVHADYDAFWDKMTEARAFHDFELPTAEGTYGFRGYVSSVSDEYEKILEDEVRFKGFTCRLTARQPARRPV